MSNTSFNYTAEAIASPEVETGAGDVRLQVEGKTWHLAGRAGRKREASLLAPLDKARQESPGRMPLPVFLGAGLGVALEQCLADTDGPVAVVDRETPILELTGTRQRFSGDPRVLWLDDPDPQRVLETLSRWQMEHGGAPFLPLPNPVYLRLAPAYYALLKERLGASSSFDFWAKARYPKFRSERPRILLISSQYFLMGEIVTACRRLGVEHHFLNLEDNEIASVDFVERLLTAVVDFKPDFVLTINHLGVDREGVLVDLLERLELPLASWFVDNPLLILYLYSRLVSPITVIFTWDADNLPSLRELGFSNVFYLPLGTDAQRFTPRPDLPQNALLRSRVGFVGNSMHSKVAHRLKRARPDRELLLSYRRVAADFRESEEPSVRALLEQKHPELLPHFYELDTPERRMAYEAMITWEATRQYRKRCIEGIMPFEPLIVGDPGWKITFKNTAYKWRWFHELNYYEELPAFYPLCEINFNCTSKQMKGAVNQRLFDVPAAGSFLLTDWRQQMERLFEPDKEVVCFKEPEAVPELTSYYLQHPAERERIALAARKRILAEHTYEHRLQTLIRDMYRVFAPSHAPRQP